MAQFEITGATLSAEEMAEELERIASEMREGITSGEVGGGWWDATELDDED